MMNINIKEKADSDRLQIKNQSKDQKLGIFSRVFPFFGPFADVRAARKAAREKNWHHAVAYYTSALKGLSNRVDIWVQYGHALKETGDVQGAKTAYYEGLKRAPGVADIYLQLGHVEKLLGSYVDAAEYYGRAHDLNPDRPDAARELAELVKQQQVADQSKALEMSKPPETSPPKSDTLPKTAEPGRPKVASDYLIPLFLLRRPDYRDVPWHFAEPNLTTPMSQLCTYEQMQGPEYKKICAELAIPTSPHRKMWEFAYIFAALQSKELLTPGSRGLGFGTGHEPLPSAFAKVGVYITATDAPADNEFSKNWASSGQWTKAIDDLWWPTILPRDKFLSQVQYRPADMNAIPADLKDYDFCWSACCLEHLGSIRRGLDFIRNSLDTLRPGGVAVHTTEFNLKSNDATIETKRLCFLRKCDIEQVIHELVADGHHVEPLNLWPGTTSLDAYIDLPPYKGGSKVSLPHLKLQLANNVCTSIGLVITKGGFET